MNILDRVAGFRTKIAENFVRLHDLGGTYLYATRLCLLTCTSVDNLVRSGVDSAAVRAVALHLLDFAESTFVLISRVGTDAIDTRVEGRLEALQHMLSPSTPPENYPFTSGHPTSESVDGVMLIAEERRRQVTDHGYVPGHDIQLYSGNNDLAQAAACYALPGSVVRSERIDFSYDLIGRDQAPAVGVVRWPWAPESHKPGDRIRDLTKAGALIAAALDVEIAKSKPN